MTRPIVRIHDTEIDEIVDREMNDKEFAQYKKDVAQYETKLAEAKTKAETKAALLERLGISEDEAKLLLS